MHDYVPAREKKTTINQTGCRFEPFLSTLANGGALEVVNSDPVLHNIHLYERVGRTQLSIINISQPMRGSIFTITINLTRGVSIKIECDAHNFMQGFVFVGQNPYYARVSNDGSYRIDNIPPGTYTLSSWHGSLGIQKRRIVVSSGRTITAHFSYSQEISKPPHPP